MKGNARLLSALMSIVLAMGLMPIPALAESGGAALRSAAITAQGSTIATATEISLNKATSGKLTTDYGERWYKVKLPKAGKFQIKMSGAYSAGGAWRLRLFDASNNELWSGLHVASDNLGGRTTVLHTTGLPAGTYYIDLYGSWYVGSSANVAYKLTLAFTPSASWETESNNNAGTADKVSLGSTVHGTVGTGVDCDWYKVAIPKGGKLRLRFSGAYSRFGSWHVRLYDKTSKQLWSGYYDGETNSTQTLVSAKVNAGTYYVSVTGGTTEHLVNLAYSLTPVFYLSNMSISKLVAGKKAFTAKWSKRAGATKYQIRYSAKSNMSGAKTVDVSAKSASKKVKGLKAKKMYWVQARAVQKIGGKTYCSSWSKKQSVKTKK